MKFSNMQKLIGIMLSAILILACATGCGGEGSESNSSGNSDAQKLSFQSASKYSFLKELDGKEVTINGYMATSSPVDGSFMFLMNLPYQNCPFCVPNTSQLSNTIEVYPKKNDKFEYTNQVIRVDGILEVAANEDEPFTDDYGYEFNYKITDATYSIIQTDELSEEMAMWQKIAESDVVTDIYSMYDYVNFLCAWNTYSVKTYKDDDGKTVPGYYLYPSDAEQYIYTDGAQWNYGYKADYFKNIIKKIEAVDPTAFDDLVKNVEKAEALSKKALKELEDKNYTSEHKYVKEFDREDDVYTLTNGDALVSEMNALYDEFSNWLGSWEL